MVAQIKNKIGKGLYSIAEAALYARVSTRMMSRWAFGAQGQPVIQPEFGPDDKVISFLDLIQTLAIREIRLQREVPLTKIRQALDVAQVRAGLSYPFAREHCVFLFGDELVIKMPNEADSYIQASGKHRSQRLFPFVQIYLKDLTFDTSGLANCYRPYKDITLNPKIRFGEPMLPSGYSALRIWESVQDEGSLELAADVNGIPKDEVETAYRFVVDHLGKAAA